MLLREKNPLTASVLGDMSSLIKSWSFGPTLCFGLDRKVLVLILTRLENIYSLDL